MKKEDVAHLASLARIKLTDEETEKIAGEFGDILEYVDQLNEIVKEGMPEKKVGANYNVLREDTDPHEPGIYTEKLLDAAPGRDGQYVKVKKILDNG